MEDDGAPGLHVGFEIDFGDAFGGLQTIDDMIGKAAADGVRSFQKLQQAVAGGLGLGDAAAQFRTLSSAATQAGETARNAYNRAGKEADALTRTIERQSATFGKSRIEILQMDAAVKAARASELGLTDVATRLTVAAEELGKATSGSVNALTHHTAATGLNRAAQMELTHVMKASFDQVAAGASPFQILTQHMAQVGQIASMTEGGFVGLGRAIGAALLPFAPFIAAVAAAGAGLALFQRSVADGVDASKMIDSLHLTKDELDKLQNKTVTFGDTFTAVWEVAAKNLGISLNAIGSGFNATMDFLTSVGEKTLAGVYAAFLGTFRSIAVIVADAFHGKGLPTMLADSAHEFVRSYDEADAKLLKLGADIRAQVGSNKMADWKKQVDAMRDGAKDAGDASDKHAQALTREAAAVEASIRNNLALGDAYARSGAEALVAEARVKAESQAIKQRGDIDAAVERQIRLAISERVKNAEQGAATTRDQAAIQAELNTQVAAGLITSKQAADLLQERMKELPLVYALEVAEQRGYKTEIEAATKALRDQRSAHLDAAAAGNGDYFTAAHEDAERQLAVLAEEAKLVGATVTARAEEMAIIQATQKLVRDGKTLNTKYADDYIADAKRIADADVQKQLRADEFTKALSAHIDLVDQLASNIRDAGDKLADAFGSAGRSLGDLASSMADYTASQLRLNDGRSKELALAAQLTNADARIAEERRVNAQYDAKNGQAQIRLYGDMAAAGQQFFKKGQLGYEALGAAEKIFRAVQFANSVQAMAQDLKETISSVFNSGRKSVAAGTEGIAHQAKLTFPLNLVAMAATAAALVSAGISVLGGGGGSSAPSVPTAENMQQNQGTGTVLGDMTAKSDSIAKSIDILAKNSNTDLEYGSAMVKSLNAIQTNIDNLAAVIGRQLNIGGGLDPSKLGLGTNTSGGLLGIGGLFSKSVTKELNDAGVQFNSGSVGQIIANGITADLYQQILVTTKKSGFFGIGGSTKTTTQNVTSAAPGDLTSEVGLLIKNMRDAIVSAAGTIGVDGAAAMLDQFNVSIGKISLKGLSASEIQDQLASVFSAVGDQMATAIAGPLAQYQQAGEGMLQTLVRLAKEYQTVDVSLRSIGMTFGSVGLASIGARDALVQLFGGLDQFTSETSFFRDNFLTEAQQMAPIISSVATEMNRLGLAGVTTKTEFANVVLGLDLSTSAGQQTYAALMAVAPAFAKVADYTTSLNGALQDTAKTAEQLAEIAKQRRSLDIDLMEATGDAAGALAAKRSDELAAMDESLRGLQSQVWAAQDGAAAQTALTAATAAATQAAQTLATTRRSLEIDLMTATGDTIGATAAKRADELAALDASLRPLKEAIYAAEDAATAQAALATAQDDATKTAAAAAEAVQQLATQRRTMEIALMEATGDTIGATAAKRADELAALDASLRPLQEQIYAATDAAAANQALADAQATAAAVAAQAAQEQAAAAAQIAQQRSTLEIALMRAQGNEAGAVAAERAQTLAGTDDQLKALQQMVWAAQDAQAAAAQAAQAQAAYAQQQQQAAEAAEQLRKTRAEMEATLLEAMGNAAGALAIRRREELAAMDASLRPLQQQIYLQQDIADARKVLTDSYKSESDALQATADKFTGFGDSLRKFRDTLGQTGDATVDAYRAAQAAFVDTSALAARDDETALGNLEQVSKDFLAASKDRAGTLLDYQRDVARVAGSVDRAIGATDTAADYAKAQLDALKQSVKGLVDIDQSVVSVHDAIVALQNLMEGGSDSVASAELPATAYTGPATSTAVTLDTTALEARVDQMATNSSIENTSMAEKLGKIERWLARFDGNGLLVRTDEDEPLKVQVEP